MRPSPARSQPYLPRTGHRAYRCAPAYLFHGIPTLVASIAIRTDGSDLPDARHRSRHAILCHQRRSSKPRSLNPAAFRPRSGPSVSGASSRWDGAKPRPTRKSHTRKSWSAELSPPVCLVPPFVVLCRHVKNMTRLLFIARPAFVPIDFRTMWAPLSLGALHRRQIRTSVYPQVESSISPARNPSFPITRRRPRLKSPTIFANSDTTSHRLGGTGGVVVFRTAGPVVMLLPELDALPVPERPTSLTPAMSPA